MADSQFSTLGLVVLAELARTRKAIGLSDAGIGDDLSNSKSGAGGTAKIWTVPIEDVGEALTRPLDHGGLEPLTTDRAAPPKPPSNVSIQELEGCEAYITDIPGGGQPAELIFDVPSRNTATSKLTKKRKKRRNLNPIDDMFEGLTSRNQ